AGRRAHRRGEVVVPRRVPAAAPRARFLRRDRGAGTRERWRVTAPVLVVGATGQLGTAVVDRLRAAGHPVRALVRPSSPRAFEPDGVELAFGDLRDPESLVAACQGV